MSAQPICGAIFEGKPIDPMPKMDATQHTRYRRHLLLEAIGASGQERLLAAKVLVIGVGGLGSAAAYYLAAAGIGSLTLVDPDRVELSNLQRQIIHDTIFCGHTKVASAAARLRAFNPDLDVQTVPFALDRGALADHIATAEVVLDCSDNLLTRQTVNQACVNQQRPLVSAAVSAFHGQLMLIDSRRSDTPCYRCVYRDGVTATEHDDTGIAAPLPGILGSLQALEAMKLVLDRPTKPGQLHVFDGLTLTWQSIRVPKQPNCPVCAQDRATPCNSE